MPVTAGDCIILDKRTLELAPAKVWFSLEPAHPKTRIMKGSNRVTTITCLSCFFRPSGLFSVFGKSIASYGHEFSQSLHCMHSEGVIPICFQENRLSQLSKTPYGQRNLQYGLAIKTPESSSIPPKINMLKGALSLKMPMKGSYRQMMKSVPVAAKVTASPR
jgi:hypothetical protein